VDQDGWLESLAGTLLGELLGRELAGFVVEQRKEWLGGLRIAVLDRR
jgi:hypothetical protein